MCSSKHKFPQHIRTCRDAFITKSVKGYLLTVSDIIIRRNIPRFNMHNHDSLSIYNLKRKRKIGHRVKFDLDYLTEFLCNELRIIQTFHRIIIIYPKNQRTAAAIGKCRYALAPALGLVYLEPLFLVIVCCLSNKTIYFYAHKSLSV